MKPADSLSYAYLLGAYLGDGYVANTGRSFQLVITLDAAYPDIVEEVRAAIVLSQTASRPRAHLHDAYPRYFFSNLSADIRALFCESCERLELRWTQSNHRNISISHRTSVALLDEYVGPKC